MNLYSCMIWLRGPPSLSSNNNLEVAGKKSGISTGASQKHLSEQRRVSRQYNFSLTCQDRESRDTKELLKEIKVKVNSKVCFTITLLDEFYGDFSLYGRKKKKILLFLSLRKAEWNLFPTLPVQVFWILGCEAPPGKSWASTQHAQL